ncbi:MAG: U32 family peptidase C-terminal domain-containing protein [Clostridia bacterium]|nr:U32 family peptidase C-terminal domain-containing protein [Clostridia bacterium]
MNRMPTLLAPAGSMRPFMTALRFGADAVYCGAKQYGLRAQAGNFDERELAQAVQAAHAAGAQVNLTLNIFARDNDLDGMVRTAQMAKEIGVDALIVSDLGAIARIHREAPGIDIHVSTQANTTNSDSVRVYRSMGASRVVLARELTMEEIERMAAELGDEIELETFIHGAVCMSYSGRCMLSSFLNGRSANRGACSQPCRWTYTLHERTRPEEAMPVEEDAAGTAILSSRDMCMIDHLPRLMESGVACFKIEGRMKTEIYIATVVGAYRRAMDAYAADPQGYAKNAALHSLLHEELDKVSHRVYDTGFYFGQPQVAGGAVGVEQAAEYMGYVLDVSGGTALVEMKNRFFVGDELETVTPSGSRKLVVEDIVIDATGEHVGVVNVPQTLVRIPCGDLLEGGDMLRGPVRNRK